MVVPLGDVLVQDAGERLVDVTVNVVEPGHKRVLYPVHQDLRAVDQRHQRDHLVDKVPGGGHGGEAATDRTEW